MKNLLLFSAVAAAALGGCSSPHDDNSAFTSTEATEPAADSGAPNGTFGATRRGRARRGTAEDRLLREHRHHALPARSGQSVEAHGQDRRLRLRRLGRRHERHDGHRRRQDRQGVRREPRGRMAARHPGRHRALRGEVAARIRHALQRTDVRAREHGRRERGARRRERGGRALSHRRGHRGFHADRDARRRSGDGAAVDGLRGHGLPRERRRSRRLRPRCARARIHRRRAPGTTRCSRST